jgi:hypothetical protein
MPAITVTVVATSHFIDIYRLQIITFFSTSIASFSYALIRPYYIKRYFKRGLEQAFIEFETVKKIIPIFLIIMAFDLLLYEGLDEGDERDYFAFVGFESMFIGISGLLMYGLIISKKESRSYISKCLFMIALGKKDIFEQMRYFSLGLREYNRYLKRNLKHQIKDIDKIFSRVSLLDNDARTRIIRSLSDSFEIEADRLKPLRSISTDLMKSQDAESTLVPESLKSQLKVIGTFLAASIPIVISIITLIMTITAD